MDTIHYKLHKAQGFTTFRKTKETNDFNLALHTNSDKENAINNRNLLAKQLKLHINQLIFANQTHSDNISVVSQTSQNLIENTDALITNINGLCLCILTADCTPVLLHDPVQKVIAAVHAGWKGTARDIVGKTVQKMKENYHCNAQDIKAIIGPCISKNVYEIGENVFKEFINLPIDLKSAFTELPQQKFLLDLKLSNKLLLRNKGICEENIITSPNCTFTENNKFYSARKDGFNTGRMVSGIMLVD